MITARVQAGARWQCVIARAAWYGSSGVAGTYTEAVWAQDHERALERFEFRVKRDIAHLSVLLKALFKVAV